MLHLRWIVSYLICAIAALTIVAAQDTGDETDDSPIPSDPVLTGTFPPLDLPTNTLATATETTTASATQPEISIPSIPPPSYSNSNATEPIFPPGSVSCQKCKYFYPKLKECNQIANRTLARLPRPDPSGHYNNLPTTAEFTTLLPFLSCICPNQGLAASKVCLMCFHISGQPNFLDQLVLQNVTNSLSAFQLACLESGDGTFVPPAARKGSSASGASRDRDSETSLRIKTLVTTAWTAIVIIAIVSSASM
ncbi:hypothetical protein BGZ67_006881 [Mortierella alpina]|nr:hypothetical protein BGZ67_006881 [Mortierella alpina]